MVGGSVGEGCWLVIREARSKKIGGKELLTSNWRNQKSKDWWERFVDYVVGEVRSMLGEPIGEGFWLFNWKSEK